MKGLDDENDYLNLSSRIWTKNEFKYTLAILISLSKYTNFKIEKLLACHQLVIDSFSSTIN